jgi:cytochrome subunit of sulfide dehydrogenase
MMKKHNRYVMLACGALLGLAFATGAWAGDLNKLIEPCTECHGKAGAGVEEMPNIGGFSSAYMRTTLTQYKNKQRPCIIMCEIVKDLSSDDINQIADYFSAQKFVRTEQKFDAELAKKGKAVHDKHCEMCHSDGGTKPTISGILAGQKMPYLEEQFKFISEGKRHMPDMMMTNFRQLDKSNYGELINYYASFK